MSYNFLRDARSIKNSALCRYDTLNGYETYFSQNGDVDGWDIYYNIYLYGCWNDTIFGTSYDRSCYVSRTNVFQYVNGEDYYFVRLMMKLTDNNLNKTVPTLTTGRIQWVTLNNPTWSSTQQMDFDLVVDNKWHLYEINMGPAKAWQGHINNLRVYPFIDGAEGDQFAIKFIKISSYDKWICKNTSCSYHNSYEHNCPGAGKRASAEAGITKLHYTTVSGVSDKLIVNIDSYGEEEFDLGNNVNLNGIEMARVISNALGRLNMGGYIFSEVEYSENDELKISSGNVGAQSSIVISDTPASRALGFFDDGGDNVSTIEAGVDSATGFDYAASRIFTGAEINKMVDDNVDNVAYLHNPDQFNVEGGRRDFNEIGISRLISNLVNTSYYQSLNNKGKTIIDLSHPINNNGRLNTIYIYGQIEDDSPAKIKICRPHRNGELTVIHSLDLPTKEPNKIYTVYPMSYKIDCNVLVSKGDLIGVYNADLYVGVSMTGLPDATFYQVSGDISDRFDPGKPYSFGIAGLAIYGCSDRYQTNSILEIDMGNRVNIEQIDLYGKEDSGYYDFNLCSCLDVSWDVNLFGESHDHLAYRWTDGTRQTFTHTNIAYGEDCLDDMVITADNGKQGDSYYTDNGVATVGPHAYFYINGDAEWLFSYACTGRTEFCSPWFPEQLTGFERDPVQFTLLFPNERTAKIHKSIMYFKEKDNFRHVELSYYLGADDSSGNTYDNNYKYVSSYNEVLLNGMSFNSTNNEFVSPYLFQNPMSDDSIYSDGKIQNPEVIQAAYTLDWTILEHRFNEIECRGFRIKCNKHHSTKMMEIEVYSRIQTDPSLIDNTTLSFSDYGDVWKSAPFTEISDSQLSAFIGGAPRYFRLELESKNKFNLNEIKMSVGDQVKLESCDTTLLLEDSKTYVTNASTPVVFENVYDKPFDLIVDLPKETYETSDIIFWSKCDSVDSLENPEIGPACFLRKEDDYSIGNDNNQCAINVPGYGLKNLVHNKEAYYSYNDMDYVYWGTITSGTSIDFCNDLYMDMHKSELTFNGVSSKYWKMDVVDTSCGVAIVKDILAYYNDERVDIIKVYAVSTPGISSQLYELDSDGTNIMGFLGITDDFDDDTYVGTWTIGGTAGSSMVEADGKICVSSYGTVSSWSGPSMTANLENDLTDFYLVTHWRVTYDEMYHYEVTLRDSADVAIMNIRVFDAWSASQSHMLEVIDKSATQLVYTAVTIPESTTIPLEIWRGGNIIRVRVGGVDWSGTIDTDIISKVRIRHRRNADYGQDPTELCTEYISITSPPMMYPGSAFGFKLNNSSSVNEIKLIHGDCSILSIGIDVSPDNGNNYVQLGALTRYTWNSGDSDYNLITSNGHLTVEHDASSSWAAIRGTVSKSSGKWYWEVKINVGDVYHMIGIGTSSELLTYPGDTYEGYSYGRESYYGYTWHSTSTSYGDAHATNDVIGVALDLDNGKIWWSRNGVWQESGNPATGANPAYTGVSGDFYPMIGLYFGGYKSTTNFGATAFQYPIPAGFDRMYRPPTDITLTKDNETTYTRFAIDLENRHDLDIIRNYGIGGNLHWLSTSASTDFSNSNVLDVSNVSWANSDKDDARWLRINLINDGTLNCIRKLGIYPDVSINACLDGDAHNCEWEDLGYIFGDYTPSINVAYGATVTGTNNYFSDWYPPYAVDGVSDNYSMGECWGFQKEGSTDPYLEIDLGQIRTIYQVKLYHGYNPDDSDYMNKNYTVSVSTSTSGSFTDIVNITNNSDFYRMHQFTPVEARRVRLTITSYDYERIYYYNESTGSYDIFDGSFLREMEVYTYPGISYVDSETWPVVCMNLLEPFGVTDHELINKDINDTATDWDNDEDFFNYSDSLLEDPKKVAFSQSGQWATEYVSVADSGDMMGESEYIFDINQFFTEGRYRVYWEAYGPSDGEISLRLDGNQVVDLFADNLGSGWLDQDGVMDVPEDGFYDVKGVQHIDPQVDWRVKDVLMQRAQGHIKWVAVKRDTATNYSYDDDSGKYGKDYLSLIKVYGDTKYNPTEYHWWWHSTLSTLSNDYMNVKVHSRSLQVDYPTSSGADTISFLEGDDFGQDIYWSVKDSLSFWWRIDDVSKLDTTFGDITFGSVNESDSFYYKWDISSLNLISGWNLVKLKFDNSNATYPETEDFYMHPFMDERLDLLNNERDLKSFVLRYRGKGSPFTMHVDDLCIRRNIFEDDVKFDKGLCLTGREYLDIPAAGLTLEQGTVEFWLKTYYDSYGRDVFGNIASKTFFTIVNNNNDIVSLGIKASQWFQASSGNLRTDLNLFDAEYANLREDSFVDRDEVVHIALAWSNDSKFMDNDQTLRLYINGELLYVSNVQWEVSDTKSVNIKFGGSNAQISYAQDSYGAGIFDNIKIYNYAKDSFKINTEGVAGDVVYTPNEFLEISEDNINFHGVGSSSLPFTFDQVPVGDSKTIYVRSNKDDNFAQSKKTASLVVSWLTTV